MVYVDPDELKWLPYVKTWLQLFDENILIPEMKDFVLSLFEAFVEDGFVFLKRRGEYAYFINQVRFNISFET